jgi:hypothetical protein
MKRLPAVLAVLPVLALLAGCSKSSLYLEVFQEKAKVQEELAALLGAVKDEASMSGVRPELKRLFRRATAIADRFKALGEASTSEKEAVEKEATESDLINRIQEATQKIVAELRRINDLPGGEAFLDQFKKMAQAP